MAVLAHDHPQVVPIVTATTRERREDEVDKVHYHFLPVSEFEALRSADGLLESAHVHGNCVVAGSDLQVAPARRRQILAKIKDLA